MSYSVQIGRVGPQGAILGGPTVETASTEADAFGIMRRAVEHARPLPHAMQFSVYGPGDHLVLNYISSMGDRPPAVAASA